MLAQQAAAALVVLVRILLPGGVVVKEGLGDDAQGILRAQAQQGVLIQPGLQLRIEAPGRPQALGAVNDLGGQMELR